MSIFGVFLLSEHNLYRPGRINVGRGATIRSFPFPCEGLKRTGGRFGISDLPYLRTAGGGHHGDAGGAPAHDILIVTRDVVGVPGNGTGCHVKGGAHGAGLRHAGVGAEAAMERSPAAGPGEGLLGNCGQVQHRVDGAGLRTRWADQGLPLCDNITEKSGISGIMEAIKETQKVRRCLLT